MGSDIISSDNDKSTKERNYVGNNDPQPQMSRKAHGMKLTPQLLKSQHLLPTSKAIGTNARRRDKTGHKIQSQQITDEQLIDRNDFAPIYAVERSSENNDKMRGNNGAVAEATGIFEPAKIGRFRAGQIAASNHKSQGVEEASKVSKVCNAREEHKVKSSHFQLLSLLGGGAYGSVFLVRKRGGSDHMTLYAMKVIKKTQTRSMAEHTRTEREVLERVQQSPFLMQMHYAFQTDCKVYFILDFACGGDFLTYIEKMERFSEATVCFYIAEVVLALERLHELKILYRDLKLENILLDPEGHIVLTDFGLAKIFNTDSDDRAHTYCGTPRYMAPEIIRRDAQGYDFAVDWWAVGVVTYELLTGTSPFKIERHKVDEYRIQKLDPDIPSTLSDTVKDFILKMLHKDPKKRLGGNCDNAIEIKNHPFFEPIDWLKLKRKQLNPPFKPQMVCEDDTQNFNQEFTSQPAIDEPFEAPVNSHKLFRGYTFVAPQHMKGRYQTQKNHNNQYCSKPVEDPPLCPSTIKLEQMVKSGSFGNCYMMSDNGKKTTYVAKVVPEVVYRAAEVDALISCGIDGHKNICRYIATYRKGSDIWIVMDHIKGGELQEHVYMNGGLPEMECRDIFLQLCDAVQYLHSKNFMHGDIKPENILFTDAQRKHIKLVDFGAACYNSSATWKDVPRFTLDYAPPEALEEEEYATYSKAFDIWCLGATLFMMYVGHPPFRRYRNEQVNEAELRQRILNMDIQNISERWDNAHAAIKHLVVKKCMLRDLEKRVYIEELQQTYLLYKTVFEIF